MNNSVKLSFSLFVFIISVLYTGSILYAINNEINDVAKNNESSWSDAANAQDTYGYGGTIRTLFTPVQVRQAGAAWRIACTPGSWLQHGFSARMAPGGYVIQFKPIQGWRQPPNRRVIVQNRLMTVSVRYTNTSVSDSDNFEMNDVAQDSENSWTDLARGQVTFGYGGTIRTLIEPAQARQAGAAWRIACTPNPWRQHGFTERVMQGAHLIEFKPVQGWRQPPNRRVVVQNRLMTIWAQYASNQGLRVMIEPPLARQAGGAWRKVGTQAWRQHGFIEPLVAGPHAIQFRPVQGWRQPPNRQVAIQQNRLMTVQARYTRP